MGILNRLFGTEDESASRRSPRDALANTPRQGSLDSEAQAIERYRYMLKTAPPETLEQAHAEAFSKLTPEQRQRVLSELAQSAPVGERESVAALSSEDPRALARAATRAEVRQPGAMERILGGPGLGGAGIGGGLGFGASLLSSFAMGFVGSMVAQSFFSAMGGWGDNPEASELADQDADTASDTHAIDEGGGDDGFGSDDLGGDFGDFEV